MRMLPRSSLFAAALLTMFVLLGPRAAAAQPATFAVDVIVADRQGGGAAAELGTLADRLVAQFPQFSRFRRVASHSFRLAPDESNAFAVPGDWEFRLAHLGPADDGIRVRVHLRGGSSVVVLPRGGLIFVGGPAVEQGTLIFAIQAR